jgi:phage tail tape-measure protein
MVLHLSRFNVDRTRGIMSRKKLIMLGMVVGSIAGGYLPAVLGFDGLMISLLGSFIGGILGIWIGYKFST